MWLTGENGPGRSLVATLDEGYALSGGLDGCSCEQATIFGQPLTTKMASMVKYTFRFDHLVF